MPDVLIYGSTLKSPAMRHEIPLGIVDPFLYAEVDGRRFAVVNVIEADRVAAAAPHVEQLAPEELGFDELVQQGLGLEALLLEVCVRAVQRIGLRAAAVPGDLPVSLADRLREEGIELRPDAELFALRRRAKTEAELAGVRRAQAAAQAGMGAAAQLLREASVDSGTLRRDGEALTAEAVRARIRETCAAAGAPAPDDIIVAPGAQGASGHEPGTGPLPAEVPIIVDLWPQDERSGCWADMTRTFVVGTPPDEVAAMHALALDALRRVEAAARPGMTGLELYGLACEPFEAAGHPTQRTKRPGERLHEGFFHSLGHGVGLEVHEEPLLGRVGHDPLVEHDVLAVEPGTYRQGYGGVRLEDLLHLEAHGAEVLTAYSYDLNP